MKNDQNVFVLQPSLYLTIYFVVAHGIGLMSFWCVSPAGCVMTIPFFCVCFLYYYHQKQPIIALKHREKREWILHYSADHTEQAILLPSGVMMSHFLILRFKTKSGDEKKSLFLFSDCFLKADYQSVRRCVRMGFL